MNEEKRARDVWRKELNRVRAGRTWEELDSDRERMGALLRTAKDIGVQDAVLMTDMCAARGMLRTFIWIKRHADIDLDLYSPAVIGACRGGQVSMLDHILTYARTSLTEQGMAVFKRAKTRGIMIAATLGNFDMCITLVYAGVDGNALLELAYLRHDPDMLEWVCDYVELWFKNGHRANAKKWREEEEEEESA